MDYVKRVIISLLDLQQLLLNMKKLKQFGIAKNVIHGIQNSKESKENIVCDNCSKILKILRR